MNRLQDKVAIITGAAAGMGRETAKLFAAEGASVAVTDLKQEDVDAVVAEITEAGETARGYVMNVAKESDVQQVIDSVATDFGKLDILINNAGITGVNKQTDTVTEDEWDAVFAVDVKGVFFCTKHAIPHFRANGRGSVVNFSSIYGLVGADELTPYAAAKGAVTNMTRQDAISFGPDHIRVNSVHPGTILTPLVKELGSRGEDGLDAYKAHMSAKHPIGYLGEPIDVAYAVLFLASDEARFITGAHLTVDGGYTAQ